MANKLGENVVVNGDKVELTGDVTISDDIDIPNGVTLSIPSGKLFNTGSNTIVNNGSVTVEGTLVITDTSQLSGGPFTIEENGKLMFGSKNYIAKKDAIVEVDGTVNVSSNEGNGYTFDIPIGVNATIVGSNSSGDYYHHGSEDVINIEGKLVINNRIANHGTIRIKSNGKLSINENGEIFAAPSNSTGTLIFEDSSELNGIDKIQGEKDLAVDNFIGTHKWSGSKWERQL